MLFAKISCYLGVAYGARRVGAGVWGVWRESERNMHTHTVIAVTVCALCECIWFEVLLKMVCKLVYGTEVNDGSLIKCSSNKD